jgi:S-DNA-T family DNA segregation ATPase FtsK/SpoIIIE
MRSSHSRAVPVQSREKRLREAGLSGARALTRLLVALIENIGQQDKMGRREDPSWAQPSESDRNPPPRNWPHGTTRTAFGPTPIGAEIERLMTAQPPRPHPHPQEPAAFESRPFDVPLTPRRPTARDAVTGLPIFDPTVRPIPSAAARRDQDLAHAAPPPQPGTVGFARGQVQRPRIAPEPPSPEPVPKDFATSDIPIWQQPFIAAPGVRYMRTPDHILRRARHVSAPMMPMMPIVAAMPLDDEPLEDDITRDAAPEDVADVETDVIDASPPFDLEAAIGPARSLARRQKPSREPAVEAPRVVPPKQPFAVAVRPKAKSEAPPPVETAAASRVTLAAPPPMPAKRRAAPTVEWDYPSADLLGEVGAPAGNTLTTDMLEQNARLLETTLEDFGIRGEIIHVRAGPVVTLYELEPAPGMKSSRVIGLADDIARSMSALSARVAVVPGRNAIGIELPNERRETVYFREMIESEAFSGSQHKLAIALGKTIGGEPVIAELAKMPHLLVAGTTGSGKSVAINTMILSLLYRLKPEECRLIMVDPKMLELSVYDGIPHLLTPVVTDPKKAVVALKWAVREMEDRYKKMSKLGVRNIDGFNARVRQAKAAGETIMMQVATGFDKETGKPVTEEQPLDLVTLPYIVVIVDEMADLMMVAGKDIEGAIQRLAQMARAAGIHLIMATQRPSVDVITGTIKANFPTRISFQVTSKIDSRTILGEQGAEQLLGQGDMLHMQGGGRIYRVHGPFVSDEDVERVVAHLKNQSAPEYLDTITDEIETDLASDDEDDADGAVFDKTAMGGEEDGDLYEQAVKIVLRDKKSSVSYVQRRLQVGYNKAASLVERMEKEGILSPASHSGKREILAHSRARVITGVPDPDDED